MPLLPGEQEYIAINDSTSEALSLAKAIKVADISTNEVCTTSNQLNACVDAIMERIYEKRNRRGLFIVFEGPDRCGKTTQANLLYEHFLNSGGQAKIVKFPDRTTPSGLLINNFLKSKGLGVPSDKIPIVSHLLFAYNRWERMNALLQDLRDGINLVCDRYSFSGVVYSEQAQGLDPSRTGVVESGLLRPDIVIQPVVSDEVLKSRPGFGEELYEYEELQQRISLHFKRYHEMSWWRVIDGDKSIEGVRDLVVEQVEKIDTVVKGPIKLLTCRDLL